MWFKIWAVCSNWLRLKKEAKAKSKQLYDFYAITKNIAEFQTNICNPNRLLVFKLDDIGDYLLFEHAFYKWLEKQASKQVYLVGNEVWKTLFEKKFSHFEIQCIWINKNKWLKEPTYQKEKAFALQAIAPEVCYYPAFTRTLTLEINMGILFPKSKHIGFDNPKNADQYLENFNFTQYLKAANDAHELELNANFWEQESDLLFSKKAKTDSNYFVVGIGGNQNSKRWSIKNYSTLIKNILTQEPHLTCFILGGKAEQAQAVQLQQLVNKTNCINYCEKISLIDLNTFCARADFAVCNDTAVAHICALHQTPVLVIANGNRFGRFFPYPKSFNWVNALYPEGLKVKNYDWEGKFPINAVSSNEVLYELKKLRNSIKN